MAAVVIQETEGHATPGHLHAQYLDGKLLLPRDVADVFRRQGVRSAEDLISYLQSFPTGAAALLHWSSHDVVDALQELEDQVGHHLSSGFLNARPFQQPPLGAFDPDDLP